MEENGRILEVLDSKPDSRRIKINSIAADRNLADMAREIIDKCKYIHPSRVEEVEQVLIQLQKALAEKEKKQEIAEAKIVKKEKKENSGRRGSAAPDSKSQRAEPAPPEEKYGPAYMERLDDYLELLYQVSGKSESDIDEGLKAQVEGTAMILKLCRSVVNLEVLIQNNTVMGALTRVLQEEFKKSAELTFNILRSVPLYVFKVVLKLENHLCAQNISCFFQFYGDAWSNGQLHHWIVDNEGETLKEVFHCNI